MNYCSVQHLAWHPHTLLLYFTLLYCSLLYTTQLHTTLHYSTLLFSTLYYSTRYYSTLYYSTLYYSTLPSLSYRTLLYSTQLYRLNSCKLIVLLQQRTFVARTKGNYSFLVGSTAYHAMPCHTMSKRIWSRYDCGSTNNGTPFLFTCPRSYLTHSLRLSSPTFFLSFSSLLRTTYYTRGVALQEQ